MSDSSLPISGPKRPKWLFVLFTAVLVLILGLILLALAEMVARYLEPEGISTFQNQPDQTVGWLPKPGESRIKNQEFDTTISINSLNMNDREWSSTDLKARSRVLALGDSHTFAIGASTQETWPKRTEAALFSEPREGRVMNAGVIGYSLGQYLLRYRMLKDQIRPTLLLVGFSMATDLYDLLPPERGGFIYGGDADRVFFDIDPNGRLVERAFRKSEAGAASALSVNEDASQSLRDYLQNFALYRRLKRSDLAMRLAMRYRPGGKSLMPAMDTVLKKELSSDDKFRWQLAELIIAQLAQEAHANNTRVALVNIPYLSQVYDSVWQTSFGQYPESYDRSLGSTRLKEICARHNVIFIDTTDAFVSAAKTGNQWLHWPIDGHPKPVGHQIISDVVVSAIVQNKLLKDRSGT